MRALGDVLRANNAEIVYYYATNMASLSLENKGGIQNGNMVSVANCPFSNPCRILSSDNLKGQGDRPTAHIIRVNNTIDSYIKERMFERIWLVIEKWANDRLKMRPAQIPMPSNNDDPLALLRRSHRLTPDNGSEDGLWTLISPVPFERTDNPVTVLKEIPDLLRDPEIQNFLEYLEPNQARARVSSGGREVFLPTSPSSSPRCL